MLEYDVTGLKPYIISTSSKGNQDKWCINNKWIKADQFGYEGLSEVVCSRLANALKYPYAVTDYEPCKILLNNKTLTGCCSNDFTNDLNVITLYRLLQYNSDVNEFVKYLNSSVSTTDKIKHTSNIINTVMKNKTFDVKDYILYILNFDSLVFNEDRHLNNIIFLYDLDKDTYYPAPLFDCGLSLMFDIKDYPTVTPLTVNLRRVANRARPFSSNFKKQEKAITEIKGKLLINSLININLNIDDLYEYYFDKYIDRVKRILKERFPNITF